MFGFTFLVGRLVLCHFMCGGHLAQVQTDYANEESAPLREGNHTEKKTNHVAFKTRHRNFLCFILFDSDAE